jgi:hypothetical protein
VQPHDAGTGLADEGVLVLGERVLELGGEFLRQSRLVLFARAAEVGIGRTVDVGVVDEYGLELPGRYVGRTVNECSGILARLQWQVETAGCLRGLPGTAGEHETTTADGKAKAAHRCSLRPFWLGVRSGLLDDDLGK